MEALLQDIRFAVRQLRKSPGFTAVALLTMALGIGANTAIYSIIHGSLQLPYPNADRLVVVGNVYPRQSLFAASWPDFLEWRSRSKSFAQMAGRFTSMMTWRGATEPQSLYIGLITEGYFGMYGMQPMLGRGFLSSEHKAGSAPVCALGEYFWRQQLKSDPNVVGKPLNLDGKTCTIVGVMPRPVPDTTPSAQVWIPMEPNPPYRERGSDYLRTVALLRPGVSIPQATAELRGIQSQIDQQFPQYSRRIVLQPLAQNIFGNLRSIMYILLSAVGLILLIACVNLANMLLARATSRAHEFAVRRALGASARRIISQALTEGLLLSLCGALVGMAFATLLTHIPIAAWPKGFLPPSSMHLDGAILAFTAVLALVTGVFFGTIPALRILYQDDKAALQQGRAGTNSAGQVRTGSILMIAEIALSMLLVAGALNMAFYFARWMHTDPGVDPQNVLLINVWLSPQQYPDPPSRWRFYSRALEGMAALPGVSRVAGSVDPPFWGSFPGGHFSYDGQPSNTAERNPVAGFHYVTPGYFGTVRTPILQGRDFSSQDRADSPKVAIINREMAEKLWRGQSAIGKRIQCCYRGGDFVVIGVASDVRFAGPAQPVGDDIYLSVEQDPWPQGLSLMLRTTTDPFSLVKSARKVVSAIDPGQAVSNITSIATLADQVVAGPRVSTLVTAILGILALLLASVGVYGVTAYSVSRREREFGIRIALGSGRFDIVRVIFSRVLVLVALGSILGGGLSFALRAWVSSLLGPTDATPILLIGSALLLCGVAALATVIPARHASRIDPMRALRSE